MSSQRDQPTASLPPSLSPAWIFAGLVLPLIVCAARSVPLIASPEIPYDTEHVYLPLARRLIDSPLEFWRSSDSLTTAPGAYVYMALLGADMEAIRTVNLVMSLTTALLLFIAAWQAAGRWAACAAAWFYAASPTLLYWTIYPLGEPLFLFLVALWLWASSWCLNNPTRQSLKTFFVVIIGGLALAGASLTRGTYMYWLLLAAIPSTIILLRNYRQGQSSLKKLSYLHLLAFIIVGAYGAKNYINFDKPIIATGAGNALYYGSNPMFKGEEPPLFGVSYDAFYVLGTAQGLSLEGDKRLSAAAKRVLRDMPLSVLASMYAHKAGTILFFSTSHLSNYKDRAWRIVLIFFSVIGAWKSRRKYFTWLVVAATLYQWAVHIPVLYNPRYSIAALDLQLTLLAAQGIALLGATSLRAWPASFLTLALISTTMMGVWMQRYGAKLLPDLRNVPIHSTDHALQQDLSFQGLTASPLDSLAEAPDGHFSIAWKKAGFHFNELSLLSLDIAEMHGTCHSVRMAYTAPSGAAKSALVSLRGFNGRYFHWGLTHIHLSEAGGTLSMAFDCRPGTKMHIAGVALKEASLGYLYRDKSHHP